MPSLNRLNIYIVKPKEAYNLVTNPSFEKGTTGYATFNSSIARVNTEQRRGAYSLEVTPNLTVQAGVYFGAVSLVAGTSYTFSVDVKGVAYEGMSLQILNTSGNPVASQTFTATGYWQRVSMAYTEISSSSRWLRVVRTNTASANIFYLDGFQMEAGAESTYFDGDMKGYVRNRVDFRWMGVAHASQSWRSGATRKGGELVNLKDFCNILGVIGLGMNALSPQALATTLPGSLYQRTSIDDREFSIPVLFDGDNFRDVMLVRKSVIDLLRPDAGSDDQPITLVMEAVDASSKAVTDRVTVAAHYTGGLEMKITGGNQRVEKATLDFVAYLPFIVSDGSRSSDLLESTSFASHVIVRQRQDGIWENVGPSGVSSLESVNSILRGPNGLMYFAGDFADLNGDTNADRIVSWDGVTFSALASGTDNIIYEIRIGPDGNLYAVGVFSSASGVANTQGLAMWNGSAWSSLATVNGTVRSLTFTDSGDLYIVGDFTTVNGITCNGIAKRTSGGTWSAVGSGINTATETINRVISVGEDIYIGGKFATVNGVTVNSVAKYSGGTWYALGTGAAIISGTVNVSGLEYDPRRNRIYITGAFSSFNGVVTEGVGYWNGSQFISLSSYMGSTSSYGQTKYAGLDRNGNLYIMMFGSTNLGGKRFPGKGIRYIGGNWLPLQIALSGSAYLRCIYDDLYSEELYFGIAAGLVTVTASTVTVGSLSTMRSSPAVAITGPGSLWEIKNYTTRQAITFTGLTLVAGEILALDLTPGQISFTSNFRGNMMRYIVPGSNLDLFLQTGANNISAFMTNTTAASQIMMTWQDTYWSLDGAVR